MNRRDFVKLSALVSGSCVWPKLATAATVARTKPAELLASPRPELGEVLYSNALTSAQELKGFRIEGPGRTSFPRGRLRLESGPEVVPGQAPNFLCWCPQDFPDRISISWNFWPLHEPGLAMMFFAATGRKGEDLFNPVLKARTGVYAEYHSGEIDALHASYFRRIQPTDKTYHYCNLRKSHGFNLVMSGADPIPEVAHADPPYNLMVVKDRDYVGLWIDELRIFEWRDDGKTSGPLLHGGKIGFRQMAPLIAEYADLTVHALQR